MAGKRRFGRVRQLPSGRWQARYKGPDGIDRPAPHTFESKASADRWLTLQEAEILHGDWIDPNSGRVNFGNYAATWIEEPPGLRPKTIELYRYLLRGHLLPTFGAMLVADIHEPHVRRWRRERLDAGASAVTVAKAYRLLKAILNTAADDGLIRRNPCRIKGASAEKSPERPVLTAQQVFALAEVIDLRYKALVLLAVFGSMRWGELTALRRCDIDLEAGTVRVVRQVTELSDGQLAPGPPKSDAGKRVVVLPAAITPGSAAAYGLVGQGRRRRLGVYEPGGHAAAAELSATCLAPRVAGRWAASNSFPRPATHRQPARSRCWRHAARVDGPDGPLNDPGRHDLSARQ